MRWSDERILTTHTGSLPRPPELTRLYVRRARGEATDRAELDRVGKAALRRIVDKQIEAGVDIGNNGEQQREAFFLYVRHRMSGFGDSWQRWPRGDVELYPLLKEQMAQMLAAREAVGNYQPPKAIGEVRYVDDTELNAEIADFRTALEAKQNGFVEPFMTAPSPGIIAAAMKNEYYDSEEAYLAAVAAAIQVEYEAIVKNGFLLQLDCPDLALERHLTYNDRPLGEFLGFVERVVAAINKAIVNVPRDRVRLRRRRRPPRTVPTWFATDPAPCATLCTGGSTSSRPSAIRRKPRTSVPGSSWRRPSRGRPTASATRPPSSSIRSWPTREHRRRSWTTSARCASSCSRDAWLRAASS